MDTENSNTHNTDKRKAAAVVTGLAVVVAVGLYVIAATSDPRQAGTTNGRFASNASMLYHFNTSRMYVTPGPTALPLLPKQFAEMKVLSSKKVLQVYGRTGQGYPATNTLAQCRRPDTTTHVFKCTLHVRGKNQKTLWYNESTKKISEQG